MTYTRINPTKGTLETGTVSAGEYGSVHAYSLYKLDGVVFLCLWITGLTQTQADGEKKVAQLPSGFRPRSEMRGAAGATQSGSGHPYYYISQGGGVYSGNTSLSNGTFLIQSTFIV